MHYDGSCKRIKGPTAMLGGVATVTLAVAGQQQEQCERLLPHPLLDMAVVLSHPLCCSGMGFPATESRSLFCHCGFLPSILFFEKEKQVDVALVGSYPLYCCFSKRSRSVLVHGAFLPAASFRCTSAEVVWHASWSACTASLLSVLWPSSGLP